MREPSSILIMAVCFSSLTYADAVDIQVENFDFRTTSTIPGMGTNQCVIRVGDVVHWTWSGNFHSVTADDNSFDSGIKNSGFVYMNTFPNAGVIGYHCTVHGIPGAGMFGTLTVDNPPTAIQLSSNSVVEHSPNGTVIGTFATSDVDQGDTFVYVLTDDAGGRFAVNGDQLVVANGALLDHATNPTHVIGVRSTDRGGSGYSVNSSFTIQVLAAPACPGDINGDHNVDLSDLTTLLSHFGTLGGATFGDGDLNGDGNVDLSDLTILLSNFGTVCP